MKPLIPLTDKRFVYVNAASTDVAKTFAKAREAMQQREASAKPTPNRSRSSALCERADACRCRTISANSPTRSHAYSVPSNHVVTASLPSERRTIAAVSGSGMAERGNIVNAQTESPFTKLAAVNVNKHVEKKGDLSYLSWAWAVDQLFRLDPDASWEYPDAKLYGETMMLFCTVTAFGKRRTAQLPVMDHRNKAIANPDAFQVNTAMQRCLVKAIALHGLGLYIYAGEDLPKVEREAVDDERLTTVLQELRDASLNGIKALQVQWNGIDEKDRTALREQLASLKEAAKVADAARAASGTGNGQAAHA